MTELAEEDFGEELQPWGSNRLAVSPWLPCLLAITLASSLVSKPPLPEDGVVKVSHAAEQGGSSLKERQFSSSSPGIGPSGQWGGHRRYGR